MDKCYTYSLHYLYEFPKHSNYLNGFCKSQFNLYAFLLFLLCKELCKMQIADRVYLAIV